MMASRFSHLFRLWLLPSLKTSSYRLHFVPLFLNLFCLCKFGLTFFLEFCPTIVQDYFWWSLISRLGLVSLVLFLALVRLFFSSVFLVSKSCEALGRARLGFYIFFDFPFFSYLALLTSKGPGRSSVLLIGSNPAEAFSSGWTDRGSDNLAVVVHQISLGEPPFPLDKGKGKINEIRYPSGSEYLRAAIQNVMVVGPSQVEPLFCEIFAARYGHPFGI